MAEKCISKFRESFKMPREILRWYPGHMAKGLIKMQSQIRNIDCVVEVHDARVPVSGRNPQFVKQLLGDKPHILVLNKVDLISNSDVNLIAKKLHESEVKNIIFTNSLHYERCRGIGRLVPKAIELISNSPRYNRTHESDLNMMVIGIPNVGKSSLINALRHKNLHKGKATPVGAQAGITTSVLYKIKVNHLPPVFLVDTPGILPPNIEDDETGLKLALCACIKETSITENVIADFLLYWLNKHGNFKYVTEYKLENPTDDIDTLLSHIATQQNKFIKFKDVSQNCYTVIPDRTHAAKTVIQQFRSGGFGKINLDRDLMAYHL